MTKKLLSTVLAMLAVATTGLAQEQTESASQEVAGVDSAFVLGAEDEIQVWVWNEPDLTASVVVRPDGRISLPLVGEVDAAGRTPGALTDELTERISRYIESPVVTVIVTTINSRQITIVGEVGAPGRYPLRQRMTVLDALGLAGGFTDFADKDELLVLRPRPDGGLEPIEVDLKAIIERGETPLVLQPGDTVVAQ